MTRGQWLKSAAVSAVCLTLLSGCAPAVQKPSIASSTPQTVIQTNVDWTPLLAAMQKSTGAAVYKLKTAVGLKNGSMTTNYSVYGTIALPDKASISIHQNNFNINFFQQGKVAYTQEQTNPWTETPSLSTFDAYKGYVPLIQKASSGKVQLNKLNRTYVVDEYCDVYQFTALAGSTGLPAFLQPASNALAATGKVSSDTPIQYTFFVGQTSGYIRNVQTSSVSGVNQVGPVTMNTDTTFFDIDNPTVAQVQVPDSLVKQLESTQS